MFANLPDGAYIDSIYKDGCVNDMKLYYDLCRACSSAAAAEAIGFPDPARDAELLSRSRRTATGGWVVQLTEAPLDLDNPAHLDALKRTYERFPEIGGRAAL